MDVEASVRPRGIKRGIRDKKIAEAFGFESADLRDMCGRMQLSARHREEFLLLAAIWRVLTPYFDGGTITAHPNGENPVTLTFKGREALDVSPDVSRTAEGK